MSQHWPNNAGAVRRCCCQKLVSRLSCSGGRRLDDCAAATTSRERKSLLIKPIDGPLPQTASKLLVSSHWRDGHVRENHSSSSMMRNQKSPVCTAFIVQITIESSSRGVHECVHRSSSTFLPLWQLRGPAQAQALYRL